MGKQFAFFVAFLGVVIIGVGVFLVNWDIPAPTRDVEKTMDNSQFLR